MTFTRPSRENIWVALWFFISWDARHCLPSVAPDKWTWWYAGGPHDWEKSQDLHKPVDCLPRFSLWESSMGLREARLEGIAAAVLLNTQQTPKLCGLLWICHRESDVISNHVPHCRGAILLLNWGRLIKSSSWRNLKKSFGPVFLSVRYTCFTWEFCCRGGSYSISWGWGLRVYKVPGEVSAAGLVTTLKSKGPLSLCVKVSWTSVTISVQ